MAERLFKVLNTRGACCHGGKGFWSLPTRGQPGAWMPPITGKLEPCFNGYHVCSDKQLIEWIGPAIFEVEVRGERIDDVEKSVVREARLLRRLNWNGQVQQLYACDCIERVLPLWEAVYPEDRAPHLAIEVTRMYVQKKASREELDLARHGAWVAAKQAEHDFEWIPWIVADTAMALARVQGTITTASEAAGAIARAAEYRARDSTISNDELREVWQAALATEREWQVARLLWYLDGEKA